MVVNELDLLLKRQRNQKGFTLVELIVTLALLMLILGFIFGFLIDNMNRFDRVNKLSQVQFDVRMSGDYITSEFRNVIEVNKDSTKMTLNTIVTNTIGLSQLQTKFPSVKQVKFWIGSEDGKYLVKYSIIGSDAKSQNQYELKSEVLMNNVTATELIAEADSVNTLYYKKLTES